MFNPNFRYTNEIVRLVTKISASREIILNSPLIPKWEVTLRREAVIHSAHSSTSIEGNRLSLTERQMQIVEFINQNGKITVGDVTKMFKITRQASLKEISKLVELEVVKLMGKGRGAHYVLS